MQKSTKALFDEAQAADRKTANEAIAKGVREAQNHWIEAGLIAGVLAAELVKVAQNSQSGAAIAAGLRSIAGRIESENNLH
ncbi:MAG: hypothetical protein VW867_07390 [Gammaproteobacteria bacterium]